MIQRIIFSGVFILCAIQGWADEIPVQSIDGGGAVAASGSVMLTGAIASHGLPGDLSGVSANATVQLSVGYFPVLSIQLEDKTAADPVWLEKMKDIVQKIDEGNSIAIPIAIPIAIAIPITTTITITITITMET